MQYHTSPFRKTSFWWLIPALVVSGLMSPRLSGQVIDPANCVPEKQFPVLAEILRDALQQSPSMVSKNLELAQAEARLIMSESQRWPRLSGSAREVAEAVSVSSGGNAYNTGTGFFYNLSLNQPLYHWGAISADVKIAELQLKMRQKDYAEAYRQLVSSLRAQFLNLILQKKVLRSREFSLDLAEKKFAVDLQKNKSGAVSAGQIHAAELALAETRLTTARTARDFRQAKRVFLKLAGIAELPDERIPDTLERPVSSLEGIQALTASGMAIPERPQSQSYRMQVQQKELEYKIARVRNLPNLDFQASTGLDNQINTSAHTATQTATYRHNVGVVLNWNIFDGFYVRGAKRNALAGKRQAERQLQIFLESQEENQRAMVEQMELAGQAEDLAERRRMDAANSFEYLKGEAAAGRVPEATISQAQAGSMNAEIAAFASRIELYARWSDLLGLLWIDPMLKNVPINPSSNYDK